MKQITTPKLEIREAQQCDFEFVTELMQNALEPYYGGDHRAHAKRIFTTHISESLPPTLMVALIM